MVKIKNLWWPAEQIEYSRNEVTKLKIFNDDRSEKEFNINNSKETKPFTPLDKIPRVRTIEWRKGYNLALEKYNMN